jgi:hypothetical protein
MPPTEYHAMSAPQFSLEQGHLSQTRELKLRDCWMSSSEAPGGLGSVGGRHDQADYADVGATGRDVSGGTAEDARTRSQERDDPGTRGAETGRVRLRDYVVTEQEQEGISVWLWAVAVAILAAIRAAVAGSQYSVLSRLDVVSRIPIKEGALTTGGIIAAVAALLVVFSGAILGGLAGLRVHREVDKARLGH